MSEYGSSDEEEINTNMENEDENESSEELSQEDLSNEGEGDTQGEGEYENDTEFNETRDNEDEDNSAEDTNYEAENDLGNSNEKSGADESTGNGDEEYEEEMEELVEEEEDEEDENGQPKLHCICQVPKGPGMVGCDFCRELFHPACIKLSDNDEAMLAAKQKGNWACPNCQMTRMKNEMNNRPNTVNNAFRGDSNQMSSGTMNNNSNMFNNDRNGSKMESSPFSKFQSPETSQNGLFGKSTGFNNFSNNNVQTMANNARNGSSGEEMQGKPSWQNGGINGNDNSKQGVSGGTNLLKPSNMAGGFMNKGPSLSQPATNIFSNGGNKASNQNPFARNTNNTFSPPPNNPFKSNSNSSDTSPNSLLSRIVQNERMIDLLMKRVQCLEEQVEKGEYGDSSSNMIEVKKPTGEVIKTNGGFNNIINKLKDIHGREIQDKGVKQEPPATQQPGKIPHHNPSNSNNWNNTAKPPTFTTNNQVNNQFQNGPAESQPYSGSQKPMVAEPRPPPQPPKAHFGGKKSTLEGVSPPKPGTGKIVGEGIMSNLQQCKGENNLSYFHCMKCNYMTTRKGRGMQHMVRLHSNEGPEPKIDSVANGMMDEDEDSMDGSAMGGMERPEGAFNQGNTSVMPERQFNQGNTMGIPQAAPGRGNASGMRKCKYCEDTFDKVSNVKNHTLNHFKEEISSKLFSQIAPQSPFSCPLCSLQQRDKIGILRHYAFSHKIILEFCNEEDLRGVDADAPNNEPSQPMQQMMPPAAPPAQQPKMISVAPMTPGGPQREFLKLREDDWNTALQLASKAKQDYLNRINERNNQLHQTQQGQSNLSGQHQMSSNAMTNNQMFGKPVTGAEQNNSNQGKVSSGILKLMRFGEIKKEKLDSNNNGNPESQRATNSPSNPFNRSAMNSNQEPKPPVSSGILKLMRFGDIKKERVDQTGNPDSQENKRPKFNNDMGMNNY